MNARLVVGLSVIVMVLLAGTFFVVMQLGGAAASSTESHSSTSVETSARTSVSHVNATQNLELRLSVNASSTGGSDGNVTVSIDVSEYNTLAAANNVSKATAWGLDGLSLGACATQVYPFGVALYSGTYTAANVSQAEPLRIYPIVACPMLIRLITGYLFQPRSDLAVVLPSGPNAIATPMSADVTATAVYMAVGASSSPSPLGPGAYTVAAGDEWGSVVVVHFTVGIGAGATSTSTSAVASSSSTGTSPTGTLEASFSVGPTQPVCSANATIGPAPSSYSSIEAVVSPSPSGQATKLPIAWTSNGCEVSGSVQASLAPGSYSLSLSSCTFMGCASALPKSFMIVAGQSTSIDVSIDTGIR